VGLKILSQQKSISKSKPNAVDIPIIVGGGIRSVEQVERAFESGAQM
jgi:imidazole glycerol phosphate synthase subunit HisF